MPFDQSTACLESAMTTDLMLLILLLDREKRL